MNISAGNWNRMIIAGIAVLAAALVTGTAFAGWLNHGAEIFLTYASAGLAWCF
ncbi:hypothetical protein [Hoeflea sp. TYP-13]|uniref:hypothetical protein n=1 Tax=Hoeflea sp. TYP-13 TaxID=3230023 RepID=UPI0034C61551